MRSGLALLAHIASTHYISIVYQLPIENVGHSRESLNFVDGATQGCFLNTIWPTLENFP